MRGEQLILTVLVRLYRLLLLAYPARFRRDFGVAMVQVLRDDLRSTIRERGPASMLIRWLLILIDLLKSAFAEHIWEVFHMPVHKLARWSGAAAALGGAFFVFISVFETSDFSGDDFYRYLFFLLPMVVLWGLALAGLHRQLPPHNGARNRLATGTALLSLLIIAVAVPLLDLTESDAAWGLIMVGFYGLVAGLTGLGIIALVHKTLGTWRFVPLLLAVSLLGFIVSGNNSDLRDNVPQLTAVLVNGFGWLLLGIALWAPMERRGEPGLPA